MRQDGDKLVALIHFPPFNVKREDSAFTKLFEEYGVEPKGMIEIKALMGDSSDNIPGVAGIGQKTAGDLIVNYGNIDYIYEHIDEIDIKKGVREKLIADKDSPSYFLYLTLEALEGSGYNGNHIADLDRKLLGVRFNIERLNLLVGEGNGL